MKLLLVLASFLAVCLAQKQLIFDGVTYTSASIQRDSVHVYAFYGIPYARQPVGRFRFTRPEPMSKINEWGLTNEEKEYYTKQRNQPKSCPQTDIFSSVYDVNSSEDCLRVDLYIKKELLESTNDRSSGMSVLLEGFDFKNSVGHKVQPLLSFLSENFDSGVSVLAVVHYRLGALGFLTTEDEYGPANLGLWDQHRALQFLKSNAGKMKVDTQRISVLGFGSGGIAASIHMVNDRNRGSFQTAVISGGSALSPDANIPRAKERAFEFGTYMGCTSGNSRKMIQCLRDTNLQKLVTAAAEPRFLFGPVADANHTSDTNKIYMSDHPEALLRKCNFDDFRGVIYGYPENAGTYRYYTQKNAKQASTQSLKEPSTVDLRIKKYLAPYEVHSDTVEVIVASAKFLYFRNYTDEQILANETLFDLLMSEALTDYLSFSPIVTAAHIHANKKKTEEYTGVFIYVRSAEPIMPSFSTHVSALSSRKLVASATYLDDMLQFIGVSGVDETDLDRGLRAAWRTAFRDFFGRTDKPSGTVSGLHEYKPTSNHINYITPVSNNRMDNSITKRYRDPVRIFWSKFIPTIRITLNEISEKSNERHATARTFKGSTLGVSILSAVLLIAVAVLAVLLWKSTRTEPAMPNVAFKRVAQTEA